MSRPPIPIDWKRVDELLEAGSLGNEIAGVFGMHQKTFYDRVVTDFGITFTEYSQPKRSKGDSIIRETQYLKAIGHSKKGDNTMLIWLGKQRLNQRESIAEFTISEEALNPFTALMGQISNLQEDRKRAATNDNSSAKSE